jgi:mono/diheme cytochrome c family protein
MMGRAIVALSLCGAAWGAEPGEELFRAKVLPVIERDCQGCHGAAMTLSNLDLRSREAMLKGGARGPAVVAGKADASLLIAAIEGRDKMQMPPGGAEKRLAPEVIAAFREWVDAGAPWPEKAAGAWEFREEDLWAFRPVRPYDATKRVDDFVNAKLRERGIEAAGRADRRTLIRRVTVDLTGLPPTPEEVAAFVNDRSPDAWEKVVERLLASPRYGERWGRHWLDVVRYADSGGYSNDFERPNAWRYRDYVIRSFNRDKPYDRFLREQIAGDELYPGDGEALIATGFLRAGPWEHTGMSVEAVTRQLFLDDVTHAAASVFLGLTLGCARCHDHKFDPIPTKDYYRMQAVFAATEFARPKLAFLPDERMDGREEEAKALRAAYERAESQAAELRARGKRQEKGLTPEQGELLRLFQKHAALYKESLDRYEAKAFAVSSGPSDDAPDGGPALRYPKRADYKPAAVHVLTGGNLQSPGEAVTPGVLSAVERYSGLAAPEIPETVSGRRAALAEWMADARNPLTARVMANRVWQYHFGRGIAGDASNFGKMGKKPSHPELLDWLAGHFVASGWSVKSLHRAVLMSEAYQRAGRHPRMEAVREKDPENALLAYFSPRRVEAEVLRDSMLAVAGELSAEAGGPGVFPEINEDVARQPQHRMGSLAPAYQPSAKKSQRNRRTIYTFQQRSLVDPMIEVFNGPSLDLSCERRDSSTVPTQAFALFNSRFAHDMALALAARLEREARGVEAQIRRGFQLTAGRDPEAGELRAARAHIAAMTEHHRRHPAPGRAKPAPLVHKITSELTGESFEFTQEEAPKDYEHNLHPSEVGPETRALADFALVLLNASEFVYVY